MRGIIYSIVAFAYLTVSGSPVLAGDAGADLGNPEEHQHPHLLHKQLSLAEQLGDLKVGVGATIVFQGIAGADEEAVSERDVADMSSSIDLELESPTFEDGTAFAHFEAGMGTGLEDDVETLSGLNYDADDEDTARLTELWLQNSFYDRLFIFTAGLIDWTVNFDENNIANDETEKYLSPIFRNNPALEFPDNTIGAILAVTPIDWFMVSVGLADGDADWENVFDNNFIIGEIAFSPEIGGKQGNYRLYGWTNNTDHFEFAGPVTDAHGTGFGFSLDQQIIDWLTVFARFGMQNEKVYVIASSWSTGLELSGSLYGRDDDHLGIACGQVILSDDYLASNPDVGRDEGHLEFYYNLSVNEHLTLSPDFQLVMNAGGVENDPLTVYGLRMQFGF